MQLLNIADSLPSINDNLNKGISKSIQYVNDIFPFLDLNTKTFLTGHDNQLLDTPIITISKGVMNSTSLLINISLTFIYTFFILYYRRSIRYFIVYQFSRGSRPEVRIAMEEIQETLQGYIGGLGIVIVILTIFNTIGLYCIGIDHALFWGALAGLLAIIPFVGTFLGGLLPFLFALATADSTWQPIAVIIYYLITQQIEGNIITPKIIGDKVDINPLVALIALVIFGSLWGLAGIVLALPIISIVRIILEKFESTESIALLMSSDIDDNYDQF